MHVRRCQICQGDRRPDWYKAATRRDSAAEDMAGGVQVLENSTQPLINTTVSELQDKLKRKKRELEAQERGTSSGHSQGEKLTTLGK